MFASSGPADPATVLKADGYPVIMDLTPDQMSEIGAGGSEPASVKPYLTRIAIGEKGRDAEIVLGLTPAGEAKARANLGDFGSSIMGLGGSGVSWHMTSGDLVVDAPASMLNGTSPQGT